MIFGSTVVPLVIGIVAVNALVVSKMSFLLAGIIGLKMLLKKEEKDTKQEIFLKEKKDGDKVRNKILLNKKPNSKFYW